MSVSLTLQQFIEQLSECGLMSGEEVSSFQQSSASVQRLRAPKEFAQALVDSGKLTKFQATNVLHGKAKSLVIGEYVVLDKLGQGGMGVVVKARHRRMDRLVAIKVLSSAAMETPSLVQRFYREVKTAARLIHPNIVMAYDAGEYEGMHFLVMELVEGHNLASVVSRCGPLPVAFAVDCIQQAARGLQYAHEHGVIHRDIKPGNLLIADFEIPQLGTQVNGQADVPTVDVSLATVAKERRVSDQPPGIVKVLDMGLARITGAAAILEESVERLTETGQVMGTCDYMAPEQAESAHSADHRADIYSLGCTLYRLLTAKAPFTADSLVQLLLAHQRAPIPSLRAGRPDVSEELEGVYRKMLAKDRKERQQSMAEVIAELEACSFVGQPVGAASHHAAADTTVARTPPSPAAEPGHPSSPPPLAAARRSPSPAAEPTPLPTTAASKQETFTIRVGEPRREHTARGRRSGVPPKPGEEKLPPPKWPIFAAAGGLLFLAVVLAIAITVVMRRKGEDRTPEPVELTEAVSQLEEKPPQDDAPPQPAPAAAEKSGPPAPQQPAPGQLPQPPVATAGETWQAAWDATDTQARKLLAEGRYGAAAAELQSLPKRFPGTLLDERVAFALQGIDSQAQAAYRSAQFQAEQLLADKKFSEAKAALQPVLDVHDWAATTESARALLAEIDKAQQAAAVAAAPAAPPAEMVPAPPPVPPPVPEQPPSEAEIRYRDEIKPIEALAAAWDFRQAADKLAGLNLDDPAVRKRLAQRRDELQRLAGLKEKIIAALAAASPPLDKMALMLRGVNGRVTGADDGGIKAELPGGKTETHPWSGLNERGRNKLLQLAVGRDNGEDWLAAGLLMLVCKDVATAEKCYDNAMARGIQVEPYLEPLAAAALVQARELIESGKSVEADALLAAIEAEYGRTDWLAANREKLAALQKTAQSRIAEAGAEKLFAEAVAEFERGDWFALQPLVDRLDSQYADAAIITDAQHKPAFAELKQAVADLGKQLVVSTDGRGDYRSIQEAIDAAPPKSVIEIRDPGPFHEKLAIPADRPNLVLRGGEGFWPQISSGGSGGTISELVTVAGSGATLERLVLTHP
nr:protein kinase [Pirellulaceae bacterium]